MIKKNERLLIDNVEYVKFRNVAHYKIYYLFDENKNRFSTLELFQFFEDINYMHYVGVSEFNGDNFRERYTQEFKERVLKAYLEERKKSYQKERRECRKKYSHSYALDNFLLSVKEQYKKDVRSIRFAWS